jgi:poly-gamma-glutamate synthesis protein (capsule biosynthesis protein)
MRSMRSWRRAGTAALLLAGCGGSSAAPPPPRGAPTPVRASSTAKPTKLPDATRFTVVASGDFLIHQPVWARALSAGGGRRYDFRPLFARIRPIIRGADLAICHIETPLQAGTPNGYPVFRTPPDLARSVKATGWDVCSTASNHSLDQGQGGIDSTRAALRHAGLKYTGSFSSAAQQRRTTMLRVKGIRVAFLSYTAVSNGQIAPHPWSVNVAEAGRILRAARRARRDGAQVVLINLHWGDEFVTRPSAAQVALARRLARSPAVTAIGGQHVHVVQPIRRIAGKPVVFGEGNLVSNQDGACCPVGSQDGIIARLTIEVRGERARVTRVRGIPVWVRHPDYTILPVKRALRHGHAADRAALSASFARTRAVLGWATA